MTTFTAEPQVMRRGERWRSEHFDAVVVDESRVKDVKDDGVIRLDRPFDSLAAAALLGVGPVIADDED